MYTSNREEANGLAKVCKSCVVPHRQSVCEGSQQGTTPSYGQNMGNKAVTLVKLVANLNSLCRKKKTQLITQAISTGSWCSPTSNWKFWFWFSTPSFPFHDKLKEPYVPWDLEAVPLQGESLNVLEAQHSYQSSLSEAIRIKASLTGFRAWSNWIGLFAK